MAKFIKNSTTINEAARRELSITRDDYALCKYFHYRQGYPKDKNPGWCNDDKGSIAEFIGITRAGLYKMIDRLERLKLVETQPTTRDMRATKLFINTDNDCKQSLQKGQSRSVNKVDTDCKQSLHQSVNKVTHKELMYSKNISKNELDQDVEKNNSITNSITQNENAASNTPKQLPLKEEEQNMRESANVAPAAAAPKLPSAWVEIIQKAGPRTPRKMQYSSERVFQIETPQEIAESLMLAGKDQMFADQIKRRCGLLPEDTITHIFTAYLENHISVCGEGYQNIKQFRYHLLNFGPKYLAARKAEPQQKPQQSRIPTYG